MYRYEYETVSCEFGGWGFGSGKRRRHRKRQSLIRMQIMWTMTRTMGTIRSLRTMMQIAPSMKMIMNLCKQDRLDAWGNLRIAFT